MYQSVLRLLQGETFGTTGSELVAPGAFRMMCYCIISCRNLGEAIQRASEFYRTFFDERSQLYANFSDHHARVGYRTRVQDGVSRVAAGDAYGLSMWHRFFGWLCGRPLELTAPYQLLLMESNPEGRSLSVQVKAMIGHDFSEGFPGFDTISRALNMSAPTLRRRLKSEGTTFQRLKDEARCEAAVLCLDRPELSISDVAMQMGFTDPSAFHRSFKKWTQQTPGQYRASRRRPSAQ